MEEVSDKFIYFDLQKNGNIHFSDKTGNIAEFILPRHPETSDLDVYYLQSMLKYFDPSKDVLENEILDAFPVLSLTKDEENKFYKLSVYRLREFYKGKIEEDEYIQASMKHLFMYSLLANPTNKTLKRVINGCLDKVTPVMYHRDERDTVDCESYHLHYLASYVPTTTFRIMKLLKGWIEGALHFYDYSVMFFDYRFVSFDNFNENIVDLKTEHLFTNAYRDPMTNKIHLNMRTIFSDINESDLYYDMEVRILDVVRKWLFTPPSNDNERDGKVMMFRNNDLKTHLEETLTFLFRKGSFRLNDVFKWNRYVNGGKFNTHYDTMFVQNSSEECSLYTLLLYLEVMGDSFIFLGDKELRVPLKGNRAYIIPHWVKHRVEGEGAREFIKTEIIFKNKDLGTTYDETLAEAFDASCYYMLQSVRHPELKDIVSQNFNTINEARFYKSVYVPKLLNKIFFIKTISKIPFEYYSTNGNLIRTNDLKFNYVTDGTYYYFKTRRKFDDSKSVVSRNEAFVMLSLMQLDIQPKKIFARSVRHCQCEHPCIDYYECFTDIQVNEEVAYWKEKSVDSCITKALECLKISSDVAIVAKVGNISIPDIPDDPETFYFAACQNIHPCDDYNQAILTEITSAGVKGDYTSLNVDFVGDQKDVIKIRQHSFKNGIVVSRKWVLDEEGAGNRFAGRNNF